MTSRTPRTSRPRSWGDAAGIVLFGNLAWLGWIWVVLLVLLPIVLLIVDEAGGELSESLWAGAGLGWQRWVLFAAGIQTTVTFLRMFVTRGATRRTLARGALLAMAALAVLGATAGTVGYLIERWMFDRMGWPHVLDGTGPIAWSDLVRLGVEHALLMATYFLAGWLVGAAFTRFRTPNAIATIPLALVPAMLVELTVSRGSGGFDIDALPDAVHDPALPVSVAVGAVVIAATAFTVTRITRSLPVR